MSIMFQWFFSLVATKYLIKIDWLTNRKFELYILKFYFVQSTLENQLHKVEITLIFTTSYFRLDIFSYIIPIVIIIFTAVHCLKSCIVYPPSIVHNSIIFLQRMHFYSLPCYKVCFFFLQFLTAIQIFWFNERFLLYFFIISFSFLTFQNLLHFYLPRLLVPDLFLRLQTFYFIFSS